MAEVIPVVEAAPVVIPEDVPEVPAEPESKEEVSPEVVDDKVEVKSETIEPPNGHVEVSDIASCSTRVSLEIHYSYESLPWLVRNRRKGPHPKR